MKKNRGISSVDNADSEISPPSLHLWLVDYRKHLLWGPVGLGIAIALFALTDVLQFTWAKMIVNVMGSFVPMISRINAQFELMQVAQLYYSVMWASLPIIYYSLEIGGKENLLLRLKSNRLLFWWLITFFTFIWLGLLYMFSYASPDPLSKGTLDVNMLHSRLGIATFGGVVISSLAALPKLVIQTISCFSDIYLKGNEI